MGSGLKPSENQYSYAKSETSAHREEQVRRLRQLAEQESVLQAAEADLAEQRAKLAADVAALDGQQCELQVASSTHSMWRATNLSRGTGRRLLLNAAPHFHPATGLFQLRATVS